MLGHISPSLIYGRLTVIFLSTYITVFCGCRLLAGRHLNIDQHDLCTVGRKSDGNRFSDAVASPGYDRDMVS